VHCDSLLTHCDVAGQPPIYRITEDELDSLCKKGAGAKLATVTKVLSENRFANNANMDGSQRPDLIPLHRETELVGFILLNQLSTSPNGQTYRKLLRMFFFRDIPEDFHADVMIEERLKAIALRLQWRCGFLFDYNGLYNRRKFRHPYDFFFKDHWSKVPDKPELYHQPFVLEHHQQTPHAGPSNS
jgi:hypothetical protein